MASQSAGGPYIGAIDQGTTGTRFVVFDGDGAPVGQADERHEQSYPRSGWVEHDPDEIWANTCSVISDGLADAGIDGADLAAVGVTNQRETAVLWERATGDPVAPAIVWQDRRTTDRIEDLEAEGQVAEIRAVTGLEPDAYFTATKLEWLLDREGRRERAADGELLAGTVDAWLVWNLTGAHATDVTNASRTMLFDVDALDWADDLLAEFGVPEACLPAVCASADATAYGRTDPAGPLGASVPVGAVLGDQQAALFGQARFEPGESKATFGTGTFVLQNTGTERVESDHGLLSTVAYQVAGEPAHYALEGSVFTTGAAVEWLGDVGIVADPEETGALARQSESTGGVYVVPAFSGLGAPHWDGRARGTILGLSRDTDRAEIARATLEGISFRVREVVDAIADDSGLDPDELRVDGGAARNDALCSIQADLLGLPVRRAAVTEATALGAAAAAGVAAGVWTDTADVREQYRADRTFEVGLDRAVADRRFDRWREAVRRAGEWARPEDENGD